MNGITISLESHFLGLGLSPVAAGDCECGTGLLQELVAGVLAEQSVQDSHTVPSSALSLKSETCSVSHFCANKLNNP